MSDANAALLSEAAEGVADKIREAKQADQQFKNRLLRGYSGTLVVQREASVRLHLHVRCVTLGMGLAMENCAVFNLGLIPERIVLPKTIRPSVGHSKFVHIDFRDGEHDVFIMIPKCIQNLESRGSAIRPERLQSFDECDSARVHATEHPKPLLIKIALLTEDRKPPKISTTRREFPYGVIKGRPHLVDDFTGHDGVIEEQRMGEIGNNDQFPVVHVMQDSVCTRLGVIGHATLELAELHMSPFEFGEDPFEGWLFESFLLDGHEVSSIHDGQAKA